MRHAGTVILLLVAFAACALSESPLPIAEAFWEAVERGDVGDLRELVRPTDELPEGDLSEHVLPVTGTEFGRIIIDGDQATVETTVTLQSDRPLRVPVETALVYQDDRWLVDYDSTVASIRVNSPVAQILRDMRAISDQIAKAMDESVTELERSLPELERQLRSIERDLKAQLPELQRSLEEFAARLEQALKGERPPPPAPKPRAI
jgi:hypothetical protein